VTLSEKAHKLFPVRAAPERPVLLLPAVAVTVPPPQDPVRPLGVATTRPTGKLSVNPMLDSEVALLFVIVKLRVVLPPNCMDAAPKLLVRTGGETARAVPVPAATSRAAINAGIAIRRHIRTTGKLRAIPATACLARRVLGRS
jgi:hypothetical protein